jgi:PqqD family protein of HPr-rel-A system
MYKQPLVKDIAISETGFVFDPFSGNTYTMNTTGLFIVRALREGLSEEEIATRLRNEFGDVTHKVDEEVRDFLRAMRDFGLLSDSE